MSDTIQVGWMLGDQSLTIKQGSSGEIQVQCIVTQADGSAVPSYDNWTCRIAFRSPYTGQIALAFTPDVAGDAMAKTLTTVMLFVPTSTAVLPPGIYPGDAKFSAPDPSTDAYFSADISLAIESSAS